MFESIYIGTSGLVGFSKSLRVISNNLANVNTPGFRGSQLQFADFFYQSGGSHAQNYASGGGNGSAQYGAGLNTLGTQIDFRAGSLQTTNNPTDLAINGDGFFILRDGDQHYFTRSGQFVADSEGFLVAAGNGFRVQVIDGSGKLSDLSLTALQYSPAKLTTSVVFDGNIQTNPDTPPSVSFDFYEANGVKHAINLLLTKNSGNAPGTPTTWTISASDINGPIAGTGTISFDVLGNSVPASSRFNLTYTPAGGVAQSVALDFSAVKTQTIVASGTTLRFKSEDGYGAGLLSSATTFDDAGQLQAKYSNGQTVKGAFLALAHFASDDDVKQAGGSLFVSTDEARVQFGRAKSGAFGSISPGSIEGSNVDLAQEFSNLIVAQRGYQASSRVISTANELVQELFDMKGRN